MNRSSRLDVFKGDHGIILINDIPFDFAAGNAAEKTIVHEPFLLSEHSLNRRIRLHFALPIPDNGRISSAPRSQAARPEAKRRRMGPRYTRPFSARRWRRDWRR